MRTTLQQLADQGQSPWVHHLARGWVHDERHGLPRLIRCGISGVVSNPASLATALTHTTVYDEQIRELLPRSDDAEQIRRRLVSSDARDACGQLLTATAGGKPLDGWVGVDVDPGFTGDPVTAVNQAEQLSDAVDRPNLLVGIPAVGNGLAAIEEATARGLSVLATGVYSPDRYRKTAIAYRRGLTRLVAAGGDPAGVSAVASVPLSRLDDKADLRLRTTGQHPELIGTLAVATAKLIRAESLSQFTGADWRQLAPLGATPLRCVWAGLTVADSRQPDLRYAEELIGPDTAALLSPHTAEAFLAHGRVRATLDLRLPAARRIAAAHVKVGISPKVIVGALEEEHAWRIAEAFRDVRALIDDKRAALLEAGAAR